MTKVHVTAAALVVVAVLIVAGTASQDQPARTAVPAGAPGRVEDSLPFAPTTARRSEFASTTTIPPETTTSTATSASVPPAPSRQAQAVAPPAEASTCDPSYPDFCIPPPPPDLDCGDIDRKRFRVIGNDPHGFDRDNDGIGCES